MILVSTFGHASPSTQQGTVAVLIVFSGKRGLDCLLNRRVVFFIEGVVLGQTLKRGRYSTCTICAARLHHRVAGANQTHHGVFELPLLGQSQVRAELCLGNKLLEEGRCLLVVVGAAKNLADLRKREAFGGSLFEEERCDFEVAQTFCSHFEISLDDPNVFFHIEF